MVKCHPKCCGMLDAVALERVLDPARLDLPVRPPVTRIWAEEMVDWTGEDDVRIHVLLDNDLTPQERGHDGIQPIRQAVQEALWAAGDPRFGHTEILTEGEYAWKLAQRPAGSPPPRVPARSEPRLPRP